MKRDPEVYVSYSELENVIADDEIDPFITDEHLGKIISRFLREQTREARGVFVCRYYYCDSVGDIAKRFGISEGKVKSVLHRMRLRLKRYLEGEGITV